jgi:hypothetical protein
MESEGGVALVSGVDPPVADFFVPRLGLVFFAVGGVPVDAGCSADDGAAGDVVWSVDDGAAGCAVDTCGGPAGRLADRRRVRRTGASEEAGVDGVDGVEAGDTVVSSLAIRAPQCPRALSAARRRVGR